MEDNTVTKESIKFKMEDENIRKLRENEYNLNLFEDQTEELCLESVRNKSRVLKHVKEQTYRICETAIRYSPSSIEFVNQDNFSEEEINQLISLAVKLRPQTIMDLKDSQKTREICMLALEQDYRYFKFICPEFQTEEICIQTLKRASLTYIEEVFSAIQNKTHEICLTAIDIWGLVIKIIPHDKITEEYCLRALKQESYALKFIDKDYQTEEMCLIAVSKNPCTIKYAKHLTDAVIDAGRKSLEEALKKLINKENYLSELLTLSGTDTTFIENILAIFDARYLGGIETKEFKKIMKVIKWN